MGISTITPTTNMAMMPNTVTTVAGTTEVYTPSSPYEHANPNRLATPTAPGTEY
jgi:hypothetical protein